MCISKKHIPRRTVLRGAGAILALPFLDAMVPARTLLAQSCHDVSQGTMPGAYTWLRPATKLSPQDIQVICAVLAQTRAGLPQDGKP